MSQLLLTLLYLVLWTGGGVAVAMLLGRRWSGGLVPGGHRLYAIALLVTGSSLLIIHGRLEHDVSRITTLCWALVSIAAFIALAVISAIHSNTTNTPEENTMTTTTETDFTKEALVVTKALLDDLATTSLPEDVEDSLVDARLAVNLALNGTKTQREYTKDLDGSPLPPPEMNIEVDTYRIELKLDEDDTPLARVTLNGEPVEEDFDVSGLLDALFGEECDCCDCKDCDPENYFAVDQNEDGTYKVIFPSNPVTGDGFKGECRDEPEALTAIALSKAIFGYASQIARKLDDLGYEREDIEELVLDDAFADRITQAVNFVFED